MSQNSLILPTTGTVSGLQMTQDINYALDTLNSLASGASAPGSPEAGQLWHDTTNNLIKLRNLANTVWIVVGAIDETNGLFVPANQAFTVPQGRLTLAGNTPVMNTDATAQASIYYTPYTGATVPVYNGAYFENSTFAQLTLALNASNHVSGKLYDVFVFINSGTLTLAAGPAWTSSAARSAAITQVGGLWVNSASITLTNGATTYSSVAANGATYVGTFYATANGQTSVQIKPAAASGGSGNIVGLWNAYNRVAVKSLCRDSTASWTYATASWRAANNSTSNAISWVDGLQQTTVKATFNAYISFGGTGNSYLVGVCLGTAGSPNLQCFAEEIANVVQNMTQAESFPPQLGFNTIIAAEYSGGGTQTAHGGGTFESLLLEGEY